MLVQGEVKEKIKFEPLIDEIKVDTAEESKKLFGSETNKEDLPTIARKLFLKVEDLKNTLKAGEDIDIQDLEAYTLDWSILNAESKNEALGNVELNKLIAEISDVLSEVHQLLNSKKN